MSRKQKMRRLRQEGLLHEFDHQVVDHYEERKVGNDWYVKSWNGGTNLWQVAIYSESSFRRYKSFQEKKQISIHKYIKRYIDRFGDFWDRKDEGKYHEYIYRVCDGNIGGWYNGQNLTYYGLVSLNH